MAQLEGLDADVLLREIGDIADRPDRRLTRFNGEKPRLVFLHRFFDSETGDGVGFGNIGAD